MKTAESRRWSATDLETILDTAADAVLRFDAAGRCTYASFASAGILGRDPESIVGSALRDIVHPDDRIGVSAAEITVALGAVGTGARFRFRLDMGGEVDATMRPAPDGGSVVVLRPTSDDDRRLSHRIADLERSNADLEQFAYVASHDLQEPLRTVRMCLELFSRRYRAQLDAEADEFIEHAVNGARRMSALIEDLLAYSRAGTTDVRMEPVDVQQVVDELACGIGSPETPTIVVDPLPTVVGDRAQLGQLMQNLIGNALKFQPAGQTAEVRVSALREPAGWQFTVSDNGIGVPEDKAEAVFAMFTRLHSRDEYPGTGMGLAICRRIVERRGGRIWLGVGANGGTTVSFTVPDLP